MQVAAACCGCYGFRPTYGVVPQEGSFLATSSLETVAWAADSPDTLSKVGQALGLPGGARALSHKPYALNPNSTARTRCPRSARRWVCPEVRVP